MTIDWSKAPEGTTHWQPENKHLRASWIKIEGGSYWFRMPDATCWVRYDAPVIWLSDIIAKPANAISPWTGEGLPPVGTICECHLPDELTHKYSWQEAKVIWHNGPTECAVIRSTSKLAWCDEFRPIRTAEQIAAEEREKVASEIMHIIESERSDAKAAYSLYDAGYRKQEQK